MCGLRRLPPAQCLCATHHVNHVADPVTVTAVAITVTVILGDHECVTNAFDQLAMHGAPAPCGAPTLCCSQQHLPSSRMPTALAAPALAALALAALALTLTATALISVPVSVT
jgi:hypothetical protein